MKHFTTEKWTDFVNEVIQGEEKELMERHLNQGCKDCQKTVSFWQKVQSTAAVEAKHQVPSDTVRIAKAAFQSSIPAAEKGGAAERAKLLFDSFLRPVYEGARSMAPGSRQLLYRAEPFHIDIQIEAKSGGGMVVSGQLLNIFQPEIMARDIRVVLSNMRGQSVQTVANEFGEFNGEIANSGDLQITISRAGGEPIVISHREALGRLSGERQ